MSNPFAFVTLLTTDDYLPGALTVVKSLLDTEPEQPFDTVCLCTPASVSAATLGALHKAFDVVVGVEQITTTSWRELDLLGRTELAAALTKLHLFRLVQYERVVFLDADTLVLRPLSQLFALPQLQNDPIGFAAAPDSGWPDSFNSGVMVATPSLATFASLIAMMDERGSWDGADQGLLNGAHAAAFAAMLISPDFFPNWTRLPFTFNATPSAAYTYAPAFRRHGTEVSVLHFIGANKPWKQERRQNSNDSAQGDYYGLVNKWWDVYERHFGTAPTSVAASRVIQPPSSFKATYFTLPPVPAPVGIRGSTSPAVDTWDPARSSPPRSSEHQMRDPINEHYDNVWDASRASQRTRFVPPTSYPAIPSETHDWYREVMRSPPNPAAIKPIFPWESRASQPTPSRSFPADEAPRALPSMTAPSPPVAPLVVESGFRNAWDDDPAINRYAQSLARANVAARASAVPSPQLTRGDLNGRVSSLVEPRAYERRGDASSRDGDDEDDEEESDEDVDRVPIVFREGQRQGDRSPRNSGSRSPVLMSPAVGALTSAPTSPVKTRSALGLSTPTGPGHTVVASRPVQSRALSSTSPRLVAQALRNSGAAREGAHGVRASRVFPAATDLGLVKSEGLAALKRFVAEVEEGEA